MLHLVRSHADLHLQYHRQEVEAEHDEHSEDTVATTHVDGDTATKQKALGSTKRDARMQKRANKRAAFLNSAYREMLSLACAAPRRWFSLGRDHTQRSRAASARCCSTTTRARWPRLARRLHAARRAPRRVPPSRSLSRTLRKRCPPRRLPTHLVASNEPTCSYLSCSLYRDLCECVCVMRLVVTHSLVTVWQRRRSSQRWQSIRCFKHEASRL